MRPFIISFQAENQFPLSLGDVLRDKIAAHEKIVDRGRNVPVAGRFRPEEKY